MRSRGEFQAACAHSRLSQSHAKASKSSCWPPGAFGKWSRGRRPAGITASQENAPSTGFIRCLGHPPALATLHAQFSKQLHLQLYLCLFPLWAGEIHLRQAVFPRRSVGEGFQTAGLCPQAPFQPSKIHFLAVLIPRLHPCCCRTTHACGTRCQETRTTAPALLVFTHMEKRHCGSCCRVPAVQENPWDVSIHARRGLGHALNKLR